MASAQRFEKHRLFRIIERFSERKIVIVGDLIADRFLFGAISRVSREAPVFILRHEQTETVAGGAGNCAVNVAALGARCFLLGVVGCDEAGGELRAGLNAAGVETEFLLEAAGWQTTTKTRIFAGQAHAPRQQVIRIDHENDCPLEAALQSKLIENLRRAARQAEALVISDYNYGVANAIAASAREIIGEFKIPIFVDSRFQLSQFADATSATPNEDEVEQLTGKKISDTQELETVCIELREKLNLNSLLVTRGSHGMMLIENEKPVLHLPAVGSREPVDVTGAGDTVMATYALAAVSGASFAEAAYLANCAGSLAVMKRGTAAVSQKELLHSLSTMDI